MSDKKKYSSDSKSKLTISYQGLGIVSVDELAQAIWTDIQALKDIYNIHYVRGSSLWLVATNEYGDPVVVQRPTGGSISYMDTHHYRPACKDYGL
jgi:hypothetical protein